MCVGGCYHSSLVWSASAAAITGWGLRPAGPATSLRWWRAWWERGGTTPAFEVEMNQVNTKRPVVFIESWVPVRPHYSTRRCQRCRCRFALEPFMFTRRMVWLEYSQRKTTLSVLGVKTGKTTSSHKLQAPPLCCRQESQTEKPHEAQCEVPVTALHKASVTWNVTQNLQNTLSFLLFSVNLQYLHIIK